MLMKKLKPASILLILLLFTIGSIEAQNFRFNPVPTDKIRINTKFIHPIFGDESDEVSIFSSVSEYSLSVPIHSQLNFLGSLPVSFYDEDNTDAEYTK